jgi:hypothetical protein
VLSAFVGVVLANQKFKDVIKNPQVYLMGFLAVLPAVLYHIYGLYIADFLQSQTNFRFFPDLIKDPFHYLKWKDLINYTLGIEFFLSAIAGVLLIKRKPYRVMFLAAFIGYFLYGTAFAYHIVTHNYYQVPLTPLIAVGLAALAGCVIENLKGHKVFGLIVLGGLVFFWSAINFWDARMTLKHASYHDQPGFYQDLGEKLKDYSVISITPDYGYRLGYWGWKQTVNWQSVGDFTLRELAGQEIDRETAFLNAIDNRDLFLVTNFEEFNRQPEVKAFLTETFPIFEEGEGYLIFDLRD